MRKPPYDSQHLRYYCSTQATTFGLIGYYREASRRNVRDRCMPDLHRGTMRHIDSILRDRGLDLIALSLHAEHVALELYYRHSWETNQLELEDRYVDDK